MRSLTRILAVSSLAAAALVPTAGTGHASLGTAGHATSARMDAVTAWNAYMGEAALAACIAPLDNPLTESRMYAMAHIAISDALNAIHPRYESYALQTRAQRGASATAAVASAARYVLVPVLKALPAPFPQACIDASVAVVQQRYAAALAAVPDGPAKDAGVAIGRAAAAAIRHLRAHDGSDTPLIVSDFPQGTAPGQWRFTPDRPFAFAPGWGKVTPFVLADSSQFRPEPPYDLTSAQYTRDLNEVKALGGDGVTTPTARTAEQTEIALFWWESSPLRWNRIARTVAAGRGLDMWEKARLFGLLNAALADGYIGSFDTKYHDLFWRPVTAIREAGSDGNPATTADPAWTPLQITPPIPDHDSAHAVEGGAAARVLARFFGTDDVSFSVCSLTPNAVATCSDPSPVVRRYSSFSQAAHENAVSRVYIGFHFRHAVQAGVRHGGRIADRAVSHLFRPLDDDSAGC